MKKLISNNKIGYSSETVTHKAKRYKIVCENGNSYSRMAIYLYTENGLGFIANENDIPKYQYVSYILENDARMNIQQQNMEAAEEYIQQITRFVIDRTKNKHG